MALWARFAMWGAGLGMIVGLTVSALAGFGCFVLLLSTGVLWRPGEAPVLPLCLAYQWTSVMLGYSFYEFAGVFPGMVVGNIDKAVFLSLLGLAALSLGILVGQTRHRERGYPLAVHSTYDVHRLFRWAVASTLVLWALDLSPMEIYFEGAQVLYRLLELTGLFGFLLLFAVFEQRRGYGYAVAFLAIQFISSLGRSGSAFSGPLILLVLVLATQWPAWSGRRADVERGRRMGAYAILAGGMLALTYMLWEGAVKGIWRPALLAREIALSPLDRLQWFLQSVGGLVSDMNWTFAAWLLASRASSGVGFFSHVIQRVPEVVPYTDGALTFRALRHVLMPRLFFPNKPNLGSDSWLIHGYAGLPAAGEQEGTSIGLGYMAQFYIDFGDVGMFVPLVLYGVLIGLFYRLIRATAPSRLFFMSAITAVFLNHFMTYDGEIAKTLGGFLQSVAAVVLLLVTAGPWLHRHFTADSMSRETRTRPEPWVAVFGEPRSTVEDAS